MGNMFSNQAKISKEKMNEAEQKLMEGNTLREKRTTLCLSILESDKKKLKQKSLDEGKTIAAMIHDWINS